MLRSTRAQNFNKTPCFGIADGNERTQNRRLTFAGRIEAAKMKMAGINGSVFTLHATIIYQYCYSLLSAPK